MNMNMNNEEQEQLNISVLLDLSTKRKKKKKTTTMAGCGCGEGDEPGCGGDALQACDSSSTTAGALASAPPMYTYSELLLRLPLKEPHPRPKLIIKVPRLVRGED